MQIKFKNQFVNIFDRRGNLVGKLPHRKPVYGLSINPQNDHVLATAGDDGKILLFDVRESPNSGKHDTFPASRFIINNPFLRCTLSGKAKDWFSFCDVQSDKSAMVGHGEFRRRHRLVGLSET
jgi:WD40 repeat protein